MRYLAGCVLAALLLAGCSGAGSDGLAVATPSASTSVSPAVPAASTKTVKLSDGVPVMKDGADYEITAKLPTYQGEDLRSYYGMTPDGRAFGSQSGPDDPATTTLAPMDAILTDPATGETEHISDGTSRPQPTQFTGMSYVDGHLVWVETTSMQIAAGTWVMYSYNPKTGKTLELDRATPAPDGSHPPGVSGDTIPRVDGNYVYYNAIRFVNDKARASVYRVPADGSTEPERMADHASNAFVSDGMLYYRDESTDNAEQAADSTPAGSPRVMEMDPETGQTRPAPQIEPGTTFQWFAAADGTFAYSGKESGRQYVRIIPRKGDPVTIQLGRHQPAGYLTASSRWVRFSVKNPSYVYDLKRRTLMKISEYDNASTNDGAGDLILHAPIRDDLGKQFPTEISFLKLHRDGHES